MTITTSNCPWSYGDFNHWKFEEINCHPFHGDIDHQTYDKKTCHLSHSENYNQFDEHTHPKYGHINDQNLDKNNHLSTICMDYREPNIDKPIPTKYLTPSDFIPSQYMVRASDYTKNWIFPKTGDKNHPSVIQVDERNRQY